MREGKGEDRGLSLPPWSDSGDGKRAEGSGHRASWDREWREGGWKRKRRFFQKGLRKKFEEQTKD